MTAVMIVVTWQLPPITGTFLWRSRCFFHHKRSH